ncbi:unnamed protein product, partial [marine sediment metagenome]
AVKGDQVGYGFTQELTENSMLNAASTAATIASAEAKKPAGKFESLKMKNYYPLKTLLTSVPLKSKLPMIQSANDKCFALSPLIVKVNAGFYDQQKRILVVTSDGTKRYFHVDLKDEKRSLPPFLIFTFVRKSAYEHLWKWISLL